MTDVDVNVKASQTRPVTTRTEGRTPGRTEGRTPGRARGRPQRGADDHDSIGTYTVGQLAEELGVTTRTLRFYEEAGIVSPARTERGSARVYDARDRARLVLALRGKRFGMSLAEIREIVDMYDAEPGEAGQIRRLLASLAQVREDLVSRQDELARTLREVDDVARRCRRRLDELDADDATSAT
jgi:DNA-binding transcriptional MerR regulator